MSFDLTQLDTQTPADHGAVVELENPFTNDPLADDDGKLVTWTLRGEDSPAVRKVVRRQQDKRNERIQKGRGADLDAATLEGQTVERLLAATITYSDNWALDGNPLPYTQENARKLLTDPRFSWLVEQLTRAMGDRRRFLPTGSTT